VTHKSNRPAALSTFNQKLFRIESSLDSRSKRGGY